MSMHTVHARFRALSRAALATVVALAAAGCDKDDPVSPANAAGTYHATTFRAIEGSTTTNVLAAGGSISLVLTPQGTTTGHLFVPASVTGDVDIDEDLAGTWTQSGGIVQLNHNADTFLRDMPFTVDGARLVGDETFGTLRIQVTLEHYGLDAPRVVPR